MAPFFLKIAKNGATLIEGIGSGTGSLSKSVLRYPLSPPGLEMRGPGLHFGGDLGADLKHFRHDYGAIPLPFSNVTTLDCLSMWGGISAISLPYRLYFTSSFQVRGSSGRLVRGWAGGVPRVAHRIFFPDQKKSCLRSFAASV